MNTFQSSVQASPVFAGAGLCAAASKTDYLTFVLGDDECGIDFDYVQDLRDYQEPAAGMHASVSIKRLINYDGTQLPTIDLRKNADPAGRNAGKTPILVVLRIDGALQGLLVTDVTGVSGISTDEIIPVPSSLSMIDYFIGLAPTAAKMLILMDINRLMPTFQLDPVEELLTAN